jgi:hypothetical protein
MDAYAPDAHQGALRPACGRRRAALFHGPSRTLLVTIITYNPCLYIRRRQAALFHRPSRTLLVTDAVVYVGGARRDWMTEAGLRRRGGPWNLYPAEWTQERKRALDMMQARARPGKGQGGGGGGT